MDFSQLAPSPPRKLEAGYGAGLLRVASRSRCGRPTPSQRLKNPMGPGGPGRPGRPSSTQRSEKLVRDGFCENGLTGGCRGDFRRSPSHKSPPGSRHVRRYMMQVLANQRLPRKASAQVFRASPIGESFRAVRFDRFAICSGCSGSVSVDGAVGGCARGEPSAVLPAARVRHFPAAVGARPLLPMIFVVEDLQFATLLPSPPSSCRCGWSPATGSRSRRTTLYCRPADSTATVEKSDGPDGP